MSAEPVPEPRPTEEARRYSPELLLLGEKPTRLYLLDMREQQEACWRYDVHWHLGLYFCADDGRLWVPTRRATGEPHAARRVINFLHPRARAAFGVWMLGYLVGVLGLILTIAAICGQRW